MSRLRVGDDDHADAASKHWEDAKTLAHASRYDGGAYLSGYVVECTLKAIILHDQSYDPASGAHDPAKLTHWHRILSRKPYGHDLEQLANTIVGAEGARYMPDFLQTRLLRASILDWSETWRYRAPGMTDVQSDVYQVWADMVHESILRMRTDGVL